MMLIEVKTGPQLAAMNQTPLVSISQESDTLVSVVECRFINDLGLNDYQLSVVRMSESTKALITIASRRRTPVFYSLEACATLVGGGGDW